MNLLLSSKRPFTSMIIPAATAASFVAPAPDTAELSVLIASVNVRVIESPVSAAVAALTDAILGPNLLYSQNNPRVY